MNFRLTAPAGTALLILATATLIGCNRPDPAAQTASNTVAFETFVKAAVQKKASELNSEELNEAVDQYLGLQAAAETATQSGLDKDPEVQAQLELNRSNVLTEAVLKRYLDANPISDAEIQTEYDEQVANVPKEYKARHILVDDKALAEAIIKKLQASKNVDTDFAAQAKEFSKDGSAAQGGDLGWFNPQSMVKPFADAVVAMDKGKFSEVPVETQFGYHVILLEDIRSPELPALAQVKDQVKQLVQRKHVRDYLAELRKNSKLDLQKAAATLVAYAHGSDTQSNDVKGNDVKSNDAKMDKPAPPSATKP
ncbi:MAG: peptidylprolyl isomerase [Gammaproteobacteria bacterium]